LPRAGAPGIPRPAEKRARVQISPWSRATAESSVLSVPLARADAAQWFERAANAGVVEAQSSLAALYLMAIPAAKPGAGGLFAEPGGAAPDFARAAHWAGRASAGGSADAKALLARIHASGPEALRDLALADALYQESAEAGSPQGALGHGLALLRESKDEAGKVAAARWFRRAAEQGDRAARADLANLVLRGFGEPEDRVRTCEWFEAAAKSGDLVAAFNFGICLAEGVGVTRDERAAALWLRRAAERVVTAQY
jgi:TPR repeat protein